MVRPLFSPPYVVNFELYFYSDSPIKMGSVRPVMIQNQDSATLPALFPSPAPIKGLKIQPSVSASPLQAPRKEAARTQEYKTPPVEITSPQKPPQPVNPASSHACSRPKTRQAPHAARHATGVIPASHSISAIPDRCSQT